MHFRIGQKIHVVLGNPNFHTMSFMSSNQKFGRVSILTNQKYECRIYFSALITNMTKQQLIRRQPAVVSIDFHF